MKMSNKNGVLLRDFPIVCVGESVGGCIDFVRSPENIAHKIVQIARTEA
jgi:hypothetical protein